MIWRLETCESLSCSILDDIRGDAPNPANAANPANYANNANSAILVKGS
jgi:hypothetical protein